MTITIMKYVGMNIDELLDYSIILQSMKYEIRNQNIIYSYLKFHSKMLKSIPHLMALKMLIKLYTFILLVARGID